MNPKFMRQLILKDDNANQDPPAGGGTGVQDPPADPPKPVEPTVKEIVEQAVKPLTDKIASLESKANQQPPAAPVVDDLDAEINLRKDQLAAVKEGKIDAKYEPEILSRLSEAQARKVGREMVSTENAKNDFFTKWNQSLSQAMEEFPELKDATSELAIEAKKLVESDPSYRRYVETMTKNPNAKIDFSTFDPRVNLRAAREAHSIVTKRNAGKPLSQQPKPGLAKTGLEGGRGSTPPAASDELAQLEKEAVDTGDPMAWQRLIKARDVAVKARK